MEQTRVPDPGSEENVETYKKHFKKNMRPEMDSMFNKNHIFVRCVFFVGFGIMDESRGMFFLRFGGQSAPNRDYFGTLLQLYYTKVGKLETSVSPTPNITFSSF